MVHRKSQRCLTKMIITPTPPIVSRTGYCFRSTSLFICLFVCLSVLMIGRLREHGWTDLHEIFREDGRCGVTIGGRPDYIFGQFRETKRYRDAQHGGGVFVRSHHSLFICLSSTRTCLVRGCCHCS